MITTLKYPILDLLRLLRKMNLLQHFVVVLYMAPEIILDKEYNLKSDIWSLGVIIYELFSKKHPYYTNSKTELWENIRKGLHINFNIISDNSIRYIVESPPISNPKQRCTWDNLL